MAEGTKTGGRQRGTPNKATAEVRDLALDHGPAAVAELARLAAEAQSETARIAACNAIIERAYGRAVPGRMIQLALPETGTSEGILHAVSAVVQAVANGQITPGEGGDICGVLESQRRAIDTHDLARRIEALEAKQK